MIIAFEGVDGAGKNTLVSAVEAELLAREIPVARVGFPRYEQSVHAQLAQAALYGQMGICLIPSMEWPRCSPLIVLKLRRI